MDLIRPPKSLLFQGFVKSVGIFFLGIAGLVTSVTTAVAVDTVRDNRSESNCRSGLVDETDRLEGEINATGWSAALDLRVNPDPKNVQKAVDELTELTMEWHRAQDRRDRADEICNEGNASP